MFKKILIANRGEIAVRIARTCHDLGIHVVAVYSDADRRALHVLEADSAVHIGAPPAAESYLNIEGIVLAALDSGAEAVHPGYGLLSENAEFAEACVSAGLVFIGPPAEAIRTMGDKAAARKLAVSNGVPVIPGYDGDEQSPARLLSLAKEMGFPVMIKAAAGGGGRGMRLVEAPDRFEEAVESARRETERSFGDGRLILERAIVGGRHIEVQVLADGHGNVVHLGERDCSVQRRHQKVIEETPSPAVDQPLRERLGEAAVRIARAVDYVSAGTVECLLDSHGEFFFLEMNTRLQVEHGVTEMVTGLDIVALQLAIASGEALPFRQEDITFRGHSIECRIYAEDPMKGYLPSPGRIESFEPPSGDGIRNDVGTYSGDEISPFYDPLLAKTLSWGNDRDEAIRRMDGALAQYRVDGVHTNLQLLRAVLAHDVFRSGEATTDFLESEASLQAPALAPPAGILIAAFGAIVSGIGIADDIWSLAGPWRGGGFVRIDLEYEGMAHRIEGQREVGSRDEWHVSIEGRDFSVRFTAVGSECIVVENEKRSESHLVARTGRGLEIAVADGRRHRFAWSLGERHATTADAHRERGLISPMPGLVLKVLVKAGEKVRTHQTMIVLEAMKMEHAIEAPYDGVVTKVNCAEGGRVAEGVVLIELEVDGAK